LNVHEYQVIGPDPEFIHRFSPVDCTIDLPVLSCISPTASFVLIGLSSANNILSDCPSGISDNTFCSGENPGRGFRANSSRTASMSLGKSGFLIRPDKPCD
jgi:hypothetical protein